MTGLTELQRDVMMELLNIGMGRAALALSEMVGEEVTLCIPFADLLSRQTAVEAIVGKGAERIIAVQQQLSGLMGGDIMLVFPEDQSLELVRAVVKEPCPLDIMTEMEQEAFMEIGNLILNACIGSISSILRSAMNSSLPILIRGSSEDIFGAQASAEEAEEAVLFLNMGFALQERAMHGCVAFIIDGDTTCALQQTIDRLVSHV
jgi:chemotaxis protein CheC